MFCVYTVYIFKVCNYFPLKTTFNYLSPHWINKDSYKVKEGLDGLTGKQTKLASYWNTPFNKICLGMRRKNGKNKATSWIVIKHQASSLFNVIAKGKFTKTSVGKSKWMSLIHGSSLEANCNKQGFNIGGGNPDRRMYVRIGIVANKQNNCKTCNSGIGFGVSISGCYGTRKKKACGSIHACGEHFQNNLATFGYILVQ